ncbi:AfsR/SARP family transcriptional regulator [Nonomuraea zeae]|uniref:AfsR/SARP family transcriptional regulator n=1 Tax=Nonomuraea zeae TaxID=1642303 RepID=A0A5S4GVF3_9ACTN|nr:AfsR/SARP family transcriptional regulator [Nonomuraea zeae]TMR36933.1 AfsR/SARP family transcriptional regulator [Nonomuraea zeae]
MSQVQMRLGVLGPLEVEIEGRQVSLPAGKHRVLLAALLLRGNLTVRRDELIDYVWDGAPPPGARGAVQTYMARLRAALQPACVIVTRSDGYLIEMPETALDLHRFRELGARAETAAAQDRAAESALLQQALELWRGPALADVPSETLRTLAAIPLAEERLATLERRIEADLTLGRHRQVLAELRTLTAEHPLHERFWGQLVMALHGSGRQAEALEAFRGLRRLLHDELGIEPGEDLQALHRQVLNGAPALPSRPRHASPLVSRPGVWRASCHLPPDVGAYAGRAELIAEATVLLAGAGRTAVPVLAVCGAPGTGKTALALRIAHQIRYAFLDGQWFVRLRDAEGKPRDPSGVLAEVLLAAGVDRASVPGDLAARAARLRAELAGRSLLLVLDDAADAAQIRPLLPGVAGCAVIVTSRTDLRGLAALHDARVVTLEPLRRAESVRLLAELVPGGEAGDEGRRAEIAGLCDDLPLAIRLAAANLIGRSPAEASRYLARLRSGDRLGMLAVAGDAEASMRAAYDRSYLALPPAARQLFRLLAPVPGDISLEAAAGLLAVPAREAEPLLATLTAAHLVRQAGAGDRYRLDPLPRLYAAERLAAEEAPFPRATATERRLVCP